MKAGPIPEAGAGELDHFFFDVEANPFLQLIAFSRGSAAFYVGAAVKPPGPY